MRCAVFFNLDDTLTQFTKEFEEIYAEAIDEAGLDEMEGRYKEYTDAFFNYFQDGWAFPRRQAMDKLTKKHGVYDPEKVEAFGEAWERIEAAAVELKPGVKEALEELDDHHLGIVSNGTGKLQRAKLKQTGIADYFDTILISGELGLRKPEQAFFAIAKDNVDADQYVMVSHAPKRDIIPARKADFTAVWLSDTEKEVPDEVATKIGSIDELPGVLADICD